MSQNANMDIVLDGLLKENIQNFLIDDVAWISYIMHITNGD